MRKLQFTFLLVLTLFVGIVACKKDDVMMPDTDDTNIAKVDSLPIKGVIKFIPSSELPEIFKEQITDLFDDKKISGSGRVTLQQQLFSSYFESHASVVESESGLTTYALPIKKSSAYMAALKEGPFKKRTNNTDCHDKDPFAALVINFSGGDVYGDTGVAQVSIAPGANPGSFYSTFTFNDGTTQTIQTTSVGNNINSNVTKSSGSSGKVNLGAIISHIWTGVKAFFSGIFNFFRAKGCKCKAKGTLTVIENRVPFSSEVFDECCSDDSSSSSSNIQGLGISENMAFDYLFPLPDSLFEEQATATNTIGVNIDDELDCCALEMVDLSVADEAIKQDFFKCACTNDDTFGIVNYLELSNDESLWLSSPENKSNRDAICTYVIENQFSKEAENFVQAALEALGNKSEETKELNQFMIDLNFYQDTKLTFEDLIKNFKNIKHSHFDSKTDRPLFDNYCAINLSHALLKSGIKINSKKVAECWGCIDKNYKFKHAIRAEELAKWLLISNIDGLGKVKKLNGSNFMSYVSGKKGIIFFKDYWQRPNENENNRTGDHIDIWTGKGLASESLFTDWFRLNYPEVMESIFGVSSLYKSKEVYFWELK